MGSFQCIDAGREILLRSPFPTALVVTENVPLSKDDVSADAYAPQFVGLLFIALRSPLTSTARSCSGFSLSTLEFVSSGSRGVAFVPVPLRCKSAVKVLVLVTLSRT